MEIIVALTPFVTGLVSLCAALSTVLPPPDFGGVQSSLAYRLTYTVINAIGLNVGHAKNTTAPK